MEVLAVGRAGRFELPDQVAQGLLIRNRILAGSLAADVLSDRTLKNVVVRDMQDFVDCFTHRLSDAKKNGELPSVFDGDATAQVLVTYLQGLFRVLGVIHNRPQVERQIDTLLQTLGL